MADRFFRDKTIKRGISNLEERKFSIYKKYAEYLERDMVEGNVRGVVDDFIHMELLYSYLSDVVYESRIRSKYISLLNGEILDMRRISEEAEHSYDYFISNARAANNEMEKGKLKENRNYVHIPYLAEKLDKCAEVLDILKKYKEEERAEYED